MIINIILIIILTVLGILILSGKGSWLIAGYNMMSDDKKKKYNYKRLCCVLGIGILLLDMCLIISSITVEFDKLFSVLEIIITALIFILANTICRRS